MDPGHQQAYGLIDFAALCAPPQTVLASGDQRYCCSGGGEATGEQDAGGVIKLRCRWRRFFARSPRRARRGSQLPRMFAKRSEFRRIPRRRRLYCRPL